MPQVRGTQGREKDGDILVRVGADLKVVKVPVPEVIVEALHDLPRSVPHAHQHNGERVVAGVEGERERGGKRGGTGGWREEQ